MIMNGIIAPLPIDIYIESFKLMVKIAKAALPIVRDVLIAIAEDICKPIDGMGADELGTRAVMAEHAGVTPETCENANGYIKKIVEIDISGESAREITPEERLLGAISAALFVAVSGVRGLDAAKLAAIAECIANGDASFGDAAVKAFGKQIAGAGADALTELFDFLCGGTGDEAVIAQGEARAVEMKLADDPDLTAREAREAIFDNARH